MVLCLYDPLRSNLDKSWELNEGERIKWDGFYATKWADSLRVTKESGQGHLLNGTCQNSPAFGLNNLPKRLHSTSSRKKALFSFSRPIMWQTAPGDSILIGRAVLDLCPILTAI